MVRIPNRLEDLFPAAAVEKIMDVLQQPDIAGKVRDTLDRVGLRDINPLEQAQQAWQQARSWIESLAPGRASNTATVINATGQLLSHELSNRPVGSAVAQIYASTATRYQSLEPCRAKADKVLFDMLGGLNILNRVSACWANDTRSGIQSLLEGYRVFTPKTDLVRLPALGNVQDLLAGIDVVEVGAANGCTAEDWSAIQSEMVGDGVSNAEDDNRLDERNCILLVSPNILSSNEARQQFETAVAAAQGFGAEVFVLMADAVVSKSLSEQLELPLLDEQLKLGFGAAIVPLDLLIGAPSGCLIVGHSVSVQTASQLCKDRGSSLGAPGLTAAALAIQLGQLNQDLGSGSLASLSVNSENLKERCRRMAIQLSGNGVVATAEEVERTVPLGPAPWNRYQLKNWAVQLTPAVSEVDVLERLARTSGNVPADGIRDETSEETSVHAEHSGTSSASGNPNDEGATSDQAPAGETHEPELSSVSILPATGGDQLMIDLRFVDPQDDHVIVEALTARSAQNDANATS